jgi:hypothetical protein
VQVGAGSGDWRRRRHGAQAGGARAGGAGGAAGGAGSAGRSAERGRLGRGAGGRWRVSGASARQGASAGARRWAQAGGRASLGGGRSRQAREWLRLGWCGSEQSAQAGPERAARAVAALAQKLEQNARWNRNRCRASRSGCGTTRFGSATARAGASSAGRWRACADAGPAAHSETVCSSLSAELAVRERAGTRMRRCRRGCWRWCRSGAQGSRCRGAATQHGPARGKQWSRAWRTSEAVEEKAADEIRRHCGLLVEDLEVARCDQTLILAEAEERL